MENGKKILVILLILSLLLNIYLFTRQNMLSYEKGKSLSLNQEALKLFRTIGQPCSAKTFEYDKIQKCISSLNQKYAVPPMEETDFKNFDRRTNETGFVVLKSTGLQSLKSVAFRLLKNHELQDAGCEIPGNITKGQPCKLSFNSFCDVGQLLEAQYEEQQVWQRIC